MPTESSSDGLDWRIELDAFEVGWPSTTARLRRELPRTYELLVGIFTESPSLASYAFSVECRGRTAQPAHSSRPPRLGEMRFALDVFVRKEQDGRGWSTEIRGFVEWPPDDDLGSRLLGLGPPFDGVPRQIADRVFLQSIPQTEDISWTSAVVGGSPGERARGVSSAIGRMFELLGRLSDGIGVCALRRFSSEVNEACGLVTETARQGRTALARLSRVAQSLCSYPGSPAWSEPEVDRMLEALDVGGAITKPWASLRRVWSLSPPSSPLDSVLRLLLPAGLSLAAPDPFLRSVRGLAYTDKAFRMGMLIESLWVLRLLAEERVGPAAYDLLFEAAAGESSHASP